MNAAWYCTVDLVSSLELGYVVREPSRATSAASSVGQQSRAEERASMRQKNLPFKKPKLTVKKLMKMKYMQGVETMLARVEWSLHWVAKLGSVHFCIQLELHDKSFLTHFITLWHWCNQDTTSHCNILHDIARISFAVQTTKLQYFLSVQSVEPIIRKWINNVRLSLYWTNLIITWFLFSCPVFFKKFALLNWGDNTDTINQGMTYNIIDKPWFYKLLRHKRLIHQVMHQEMRKKNILDKELFKRWRW